LRVPNIFLLKLNKLFMFPKVIFFQFASINKIEKFNRPDNKSEMITYGYYRTSEGFLIVKTPTEKCIIPEMIYNLDNETRKKIKFFASSRYTFTTNNEIDQDDFLGILSLQQLGIFITPFARNFAGTYEKITGEPVLTVNDSSIISCAYARKAKNENLRYFFENSCKPTIFQRGYYIITVKVAGAKYSFPHFFARRTKCNLPEYSFTEIFPSRKYRHIIKAISIQSFLIEFADTEICKKFVALFPASPQTTKYLNQFKILSRISTQDKNINKIISRTYDLSEIGRFDFKPDSGFGAIEFINITLFRGVYLCGFKKRFFKFIYVREFKQELVKIPKKINFLMPYKGTKKNRRLAKIFADTTYAQINLAHQKYSIIHGDFLAIYRPSPTSFLEAKLNNAVLSFTFSEKRAAKIDIYKFLAQYENSLVRYEYKNGIITPIF